MSAIRNRLKRAEASVRGGHCSQCRLSPDGPGRILVAYDEAARREALDERCPECGQPLWTVINVVYENEPKGEGSC